MTFHETRKHRRFNVELDASVTAADRRLAARTRDISRSGICIITPEQVPAGTAVAVHLVLSFGENAVSEPLRVEARVVWCTALFGSYQVGAMFVGIRGEQAQFLDMFLRFLDGTLTPEGIGAPQQVQGESDGRAGEDDVDIEEQPVDEDDPFRP